MQHHCTQTCSMNGYSQLFQQAHQSPMTTLFAMSTPNLFTGHMVQKRKASEDERVQSPVKK